MEMKMFRNDIDLGNGDPVVIVPSRDGRAQTPVTLGTGFEGYQDLEYQLAYVHDTGESTQNITSESARTLCELDADSYDIFTVDGRVEV